MTTVYLIRHAQADGNLYRRCQARYDSLVTPVGYEQIAALEARFRSTHFDAVYSSDTFRTTTTAKAIFISHGLPLHTDPDLREISAGIWEDKPWGEILQADKESQMAFWRCDPSWKVDGSETFAEIQQRFDRAVRRIAAAHPNQTVAVFAHGCIIRSTLALWLGVPLNRIADIPHGYNTSVAKLACQNDKITVCWYNDISHLPQTLTKATHPTAQSEDDLISTCVYFHPVISENDQKAWMECDASHKPHTGCAFLALLNKTTIGILALDPSTDGSTGIGWITRLYVKPEFRRDNLTVQLLGQAVSTYRGLGRDHLRVSCHPTEMPFYEKYGFYRISDDCPKASGEYVLEKHIGTDHP